MPPRGRKAHRLVIPGNLYKSLRNDAAEYSVSVRGTIEKTGEARRRSLMLLPEPPTSHVLWGRLGAASRHEEAPKPPASLKPANNTAGQVTRQLSAAADSFCTNPRRTWLALSPSLLRLVLRIRRYPPGLSRYCGPISSKSFFTAVSSRRMLIPRR